MGQQQALEFGRWLRSRYAAVHALLPTAHQEGAVVARTTNYSRTIATLQVRGQRAGWPPLAFRGTCSPCPVGLGRSIFEEDWRRGKFQTQSIETPSFRERAGGRLLLTLRPLGAAAPCLPPLQGVLTGLFPGTTAPIPVHTTEEIDEILYTNVKSCKRLHTLMQHLNRQQKGAPLPRCTLVGLRTGLLSPCASTSYCHNLIPGTLPPLRC